MPGGDQPPAQGLGGTVGGNMIDPDLKSTVNARVQRPRIPELPAFLREEMERKKAQYRLVSSHEGDTQKRQAPVHSSMKIEATTSRERNMELASKVGIHDSTVQSRPATSSEIARLGTSDKQASDQEHPAQSGTSELVGQKNTAESGADAPGDLETAAPASQEQDEANAAASPVKDVQYDEVAADRAFDATSFLQDLVESCVLRCDEREKKRKEGTGTRVRFEHVAFQAKNPKGLQQKFGSISTLLRLTGISGRAQGQFLCMAGVALGPSGLFFMGDQDNADLLDTSHLDELRTQDVAPNLLVNSEIRAVLCAAEKEKTEAWRLAMGLGNADAEQPGSPSKEVGRGQTSEAPAAAHTGDTFGRRVVLDGVTQERIFSPALHSPASQEVSFAPTSMAKAVEMRCWGLTFIADVENHCLQVLRADGKHVRRFGTFGQEPGNFNALQDLVVHHEQNFEENFEEMLTLYVADTYNHRIQVFSVGSPDASDMKLVRIIGGFGTEDGLFNYPAGITLHQETQTIIVADTGNDRIQILTSTGEHLRSIGLLGKHETNKEAMQGLQWKRIGTEEPASGTELKNEAIAAVLRTKNELTREELGKVNEPNLKDDSYIKVDDSYFKMADPQPLFKLPYDVLVINEKIYVTDHGNHRIQVLTMDGLHVRSLGSHGTKTGMFVGPRRMMEGPSGLLLVSDQVTSSDSLTTHTAENHRVQILSADCDAEDTSFTWRRLR